MPVSGGEWDGSVGDEPPCERVARFSGTMCAGRIVDTDMTGVPQFREISPQPALHGRGVEEALRSYFRRDVSGTGFLVGIAVVVSAGCFVLGAWRWSGVFQPVGFVAAAVALVGLPFARRRFRRYRTCRAIMGAYTWRECRARVQASDRLGVELADTEGNPVCRMEAARLDVVRMGHTGFETAWFAGDLRFGGVLGQPGGCGWTVPVYRVPPGRERGSDLADRTAREAGLVPRDWAAA